VYFACAHTHTHTSLSGSSIAIGRDAASVQQVKPNADHVSCCCRNRTKNASCTSSVTLAATINCRTPLVEIEEIEKARIAPLPVFFGAHLILRRSL
jgi:hypothetical protein